MLGLNIWNKQKQNFKEVDISVANQKSKRLKLKIYCNSCLISQTIAEEYYFGFVTEVWRRVEFQVHFQIVQIKIKVVEESKIMSNNSNPTGTGVLEGEAVKSSSSLGGGGGGGRGGAECEAHYTTLSSSTKLTPDYSKQSRG